MSKHATDGSIRNPTTDSTLNVLIRCGIRLYLFFVRIHYHYADLGEDTAVPTLDTARWYSSESFLHNFSRWWVNVSIMTCMSLGPN